MNSRVLSPSSPYVLALREAKQVALRAARAPARRHPLQKFPSPRLRGEG